MLKADTPTRCNVTLNKHCCEVLFHEGYFCFYFRAQSFAERLRLGIAVIHGEVQDAESDLVDGRHSPPTVKNAAAIHPSLEIPSMFTLSFIWMFRVDAYSAMILVVPSAGLYQRKAPKARVTHRVMRCLWKA